MKSSNRESFLWTFYDNLSMTETIQEVEEAIENKRQIHHIVINAGKIVSMHKNKELRKSVNNADIINIDGQAVKWAAQFLGKPVKERVAGVDLFEKLLEFAHQNKYKVFLLGATDEVVNKVAEKISQNYDEKVIAGIQNGYFKKEEEALIVSKINETQPQMLFVAISSPKKELFLDKYKYNLKDVNFIMGVGGSFDVYSGLIKRAPVWMQRYGLEWFYRFLQEPKRMWKRYLVGNTKFIYFVLREKFK
jgi:N-acetylglucosaminyldiphosphoundecaprenol N-acetyl-beta-D-mannosaminyltransferase